MIKKDEAHSRVPQKMVADQSAADIDEPIEDPFHGMPLLARRIRIRPQHLIDHR